MSIETHEQQGVLLASGHIIHYSNQSITLTWGKFT